MLQVHRLVKRFGTVGAVNEVSFEVPEGSFFTFLGPSGCGKTTILRCIAGLERPEEGRITIAGEEVFSPNRFVPPERRPIAMVFQSYAIWPHMTVFENAAFPLRYGRNRCHPKEVRRRVKSMLERVGLAEMTNRWATQLSGGQQQRLALARALLCEPKLLLLDEPLSNLDAKLRASLRNELKSFQRAFSVTAIYVTHDQSEALALSDHIAVLDRGRIQQIGTPRELYRHPANAFVAHFIGDAALIPGELQSDGKGIMTPLGRFETLGTTQANASPVLVCFRPESVRVSTQPPNDDTALPNTFSGIARSVDFLGDHLEVAVEAQSWRLKAHVPNTLSIQEGQELTLTVPHEEVMVVPPEPNMSRETTPSEQVLESQ